MNILIKLSCLIGLVIAPILGGHAIEDTAADAPKENTIQVDTEKQVVVQMSSDDDELFTATVTITTQEDGYTKKVSKLFTGTKAQVDAQIQAMDVVVPPTPPKPPVVDSNTDA